MPDDPSIHDLAANLVMSEPFMQIGTTIAHAGSKVQDAWDTVSAHLSDLAAKAAPAAQSAVQTVSNALSPTLKAETVKASEVQPIRVKASDVTPITVKASDITPAPAQPATAKAPGSGLGVMGAAIQGAGALMPTVGGIVGGIVGGVPGAAAGGAAGEGYRQAIQHAGELPGAVVDVARNLVHEPVATIKGFAQGAIGGGESAALEGAGQGAGQLLGEKAVQGAAGLSKWLMNRATTRVSARLMQEFPELSDTLIDNALTVSKGGEGRARSLLMAAKGKATAALKVADAAGATIPVEMSPEVGDSFKTALLDQAVKSGKTPAVPNQPISLATKRLDAATQTLFQQIDHAGTTGGALDLTPTQADLLKRQLQKESRALYMNRVAMNGPKAMPAEATVRAELASRLNDAIDTVASGYKAANAEAKPLIGAVRGLKQAIRPNGNLYQAMVRPAVGAALGGAAGGKEGGTAGAVAGTIAGAALTSPAGMSREAILLAHPAVKAAIRQLPKPLAQALVELINGGESTPAPTTPIAAGQ